MDPVLYAILSALVPVFVTLAVFGAPTGMLFIVRHFRLREKELEMGRDRRLATLEQERALLQVQLDQATSELEFVKKLMSGSPAFGGDRPPPVRVQLEEPRPALELGAGEAHADDDAERAGARKA